MFDPRHLNNAQKEDVASVLETCKEMRLYNRLGRKGYNHTRTMRSHSKMPMFFVFDRELKKYFDPNFDKHEQNKHQRDLVNMLRNKYGWDFRTNE